MLEEIPQLHQPHQVLCKVGYYKKTQNVKETLEITVDETANVPAGPFAARIVERDGKFLAIIYQPDTGGTNWTKVDGGKRRTSPSCVDAPKDLEYFDRVENHPLQVHRDGTMELVIPAIRKPWKPDKRNTYKGDAHRRKLQKALDMINEVRDEAPEKCRIFKDDDGRLAIKYQPPEITMFESGEQE